jgi:uncharacterized damage-inducible protein DinB
MKTSEITPSEYAHYYQNYIDKAGEVDLIEELEISVHRLVRFVREIPMDKFDYRYADGKWTIKDILQHLIDAERIFSYRALRFARKDETPLASFEENDYADVANGHQRSIQDLLTELAVVRQSTLSLFKTFDDETLKRIGIASNNPMSVRALGFVIIGHQNHHEQVYQERYL